MSSLEEVARTWLTDPAWQKVFKHTVDVLEDYVCYVMVAVGAIALSVRLITTLSTGELCKEAFSNIFWLLFVGVCRVTENSNSIVFFQVFFCRKQGEWEKIEIEMLIFFVGQ